jgi:hypothetical protein
VEPATFCEKPEPKTIKSYNSSKFNYKKRGPKVIGPLLLFFTLSIYSKRVKSLSLVFYVALVAERPLIGCEFVWIPGIHCRQILSCSHGTREGIGTS